MNERSNRVFTVAEAAVAFARHGVALETIARALVTPVERVSSVCGRAIERGELQYMPPLSPADARTSHLAEVLTLRAALDDARALNAELQRQWLDDAERFHHVAKLTKSEARLVAALVKSGRATKDRLYWSLYGEDIDGGRDPKIIDVLICKVRNKLTPLGITIETYWGAGYGMTAENIGKMRTLAGQQVIDSPPLVPELESAA